MCLNSLRIVADNHTLAAQARPDTQRILVNTRMWAAQECLNIH